MQRCCLPHLKYHLNNKRRAYQTIFFQYSSQINKSSSQEEYNTKNYDPTNNYRSSIQNPESSILICGDGDLSFGASLATDFATKHPSSNIPHLIVSVRESQTEHSSTFKDSIKNVQLIQKYGHEVCYNVDAMKLESYFGNNEVQFDRVQFNFPHWKGKTNAKRNRELVSNFISSSKSVLSTGGQIHTALTSYQGGSNATTPTEWRQSWMPTQYAANENLLLTHVLPFNPTYNLSAYRWRDEGFRPRGQFQMYIYSDPDGVIQCSKDVQFFSFFHIFLALPKDLPHIDMSTLPNLTNDELLKLKTENSILNDQVIQGLIQPHIPDGFRAETNLIRVRDGRKYVRNPMDYLFAEYLICIFGEKQVINRHVSEKFKSDIEYSLQKSFKGSYSGRWPVSHILPYSVLRNYKENVFP